MISRLTGRQQPEFSAGIPAMSPGDATARFGMRVGIRPLPWEWMAIRAAQSQLPADDRGVRLWTHRVVAWEVTRQQKKER